MRIESYSKRDIVVQQIETALRLFAEKRDLFSVITLAGAAEEILAELLMAKKGEQGALRRVLEILRPKSAKGEESVWLEARETADEIHTDPYQEALFLLGRAIDDYEVLTGTVSPAMRRFNEEVRARLS